MGDGEAGGSVPLHFPLKSGFVDRGGLCLQNGSVLDLLNLGVVGVPHGPPAVVIGPELRIRIELNLQEILGQAAVGLVELDQVGSRREGSFLQFDLPVQASHLDSLGPEDFQESNHPGHVPLHRDQVAEGRIVPAFLQGVPGLYVEVLQDGPGRHRRELEGRQYAGLHVVDVVSPSKGLHRILRHRMTPVPFALLSSSSPRRRTQMPCGSENADTVGFLLLVLRFLHLRCLLFLSGNPEGIQVNISGALRFVHPHQPVVIVDHRSVITWRPSIHEGVGVHARHVPLGHLCHLPIGEPRQLTEEDRIEIGILGRPAAVGVEERSGLVDVVHDRGERREIPIRQSPRHHLGEIDVPVVVVEHVLPPVGHGDSPGARSLFFFTGNAVRLLTGNAVRLFTGNAVRLFTGNAVRLLTGNAVLFQRLRLQESFSLQSPVEPVHDTIPPIGIGHGSDGDEDVLPDACDEGRRLRGHPVRQLHEHFRCPGLAAVKAPYHMIVGLGRVEDPLDLRLGKAPGIGDAGQILPVSFQSSHVLVRRNPDHHQLPALVRLAD